jgi:hypothetical protein
MLIYNMSFTIKGVDIDTPGNIPVRGYLVLTMYSSHVENIMDANLIIYGKNTEGVKTYVILNDTDVNDFLDISRDVSGESYEYIYMAIDTKGFFNFDSALTGKYKLMDIGQAGDVSVPCSLKGVIYSRGGLFFNMDGSFRGTATAKAALWGSVTKAVNEDSLTQDNAVEMLRTMLEEKHYQQFSPAF